MLFLPFGTIKISKLPATSLGSVLGLKVHANSCLALLLRYTTNKCRRHPGDVNVGDSEKHLSHS